MAGRFSIEAVFKAVDRITAPVSKMQNRVGKFTRTMNRDLNKVNRTVNKLAGGMKRAGVAMIASLTGVAFAAKNILGAGADFEQAITDVGAVSLKTRGQIKSLEKQALELGRTTKFTATQAANAMEVMARAGFKTNEILNATPAVLSAAAASGLEIADVANHVSNVLKGMGLETSEAARVADVLALASARTNSSIGSLGESMKNVASTARQLGIPLEQAVASVALLQDVGLDASVSGSAFNVMLTKMAAPSVKITKVMRRLGLSFKDAKGNMKALPTVLKDLSIASKKMGGNFNQVAFLAELVGLRGQKAAANLSKLFESGKLKELTKELTKAKGSADKMAALRMDTFKGSLLLLGSAIDGVKVKIFDLNKGPLKDTIDSFTKWVTEQGPEIAEKIGGSLSEIIENFENIVTWLSRVGKGLAVFIAFSVILKTLIGLMTLFNLVAAANPLVLIAIGITAAAVAMKLLIDNIDSINDGFDSMPKLLQLALAPIRLILAAIKGVKMAMQGLGNLAGAFSVGGISGVMDHLFGDDEQTKLSSNPQVVSPQERVARSIEENKTSAEVTIKAGQGTSAEVTGGKLGSNLQLEQSGAFN